MKRPFQTVTPAKVGRSVFDLSYTHLTTGDMGKLYPVMVREMVPGDVFDIGVKLVIRFFPMVAPPLHKVDAYIHYFFVPYRILWHDDDPNSGSWEEFIGGGADGTSAPTFPTYSGTPAAGSLTDFLGWPISVALTNLPASYMPVYAYNRIFNEFYRDETNVTEVTASSNSLQRRAWAKDYFTSALPWQQRGTAPALPISGVIDVDPKDTDITVTNELSDPARVLKATYDSAGTYYSLATVNSLTSDSELRWSDPALEVDLSGATTFDVSDLRLAFQTQVYLERNARGGARYTEWLRAHFQVAPRDDRLDRPEYFGGLRAPVIFSEVLQTSETGTTPQGTLAGHGISVASKRIGKYRAEEYGLVMGILSVMPEAMYQQGLDRQWIKTTRLDFYTPEFAHLSEQPIYNGELYMQGAAADANVFGYQEIWSEMRSGKSMVTGGMRSTFDYWHMSRQFSSLPTLGSTFVQCDPRDDIMAAPGSDQMVIHVGNSIRAVRPLPISSNPGLIDH